MLDDIRDTLSENFSTIAPVVLILLILVGIGVLFVQSVMPAWGAHETLVAQILDGQVLINQRQVEQIESENIVILQSQISRVEQNIGELTQNYLTTIQAEGMVELLYVYAGASRVAIANLQAQQPAQPATNPAYNVQSFRFQVTGPVFNLFTFLMRIHESSVPAVTLDNLVIGKNAEGQPNLTADLILSSSRYASGDALGHLLDFSIPTPMAPTLQPSPTPEPTPSVTPTPGTSSSNTGLPVAAGNSTSQLMNAAATIEPCPGTLASLLQPGERAVVDFNSAGALRLLTTIGGGPNETIAQAYDNQWLDLLEGPVCGLAGSERNGWYWRARLGLYEGWIAETGGEYRWLCPASNPECT